MKASIQTKLLTMCIFLVLMTTIGISVTYYVLTKRNKHRESRQRIQIAFDIIFHDFSNQIQTYTTKLQNFWQATPNLSWVTRSYNQEPDQIRSVSFIVTNFKELVTDLEGFGRAISADQLALYGADKRLLLVYDRHYGEETLGVHTVSQTGNDTYLALDDPELASPILFGDKPVPDVPLPAGVAASYTGELPETISAIPFHKDNQLGIRISVPVYYQQEKTGVLVAEVFYTQDTVTEYASLSKTAVNFFADERLSVGTLLAQEQFVPDTSEEIFHCAEIIAGEKSIDVSPVAFNEQDYYQGQCVFTNPDGTHIGAISVSLSQDIEKQEIRKLLTAVLTISIIVSGIAFGLTVMSSRRPVRFLQQLIIAIDRLSKGEIPDEITEKYKGEFNDIKQNLNRLIQTMHEMTEIARQVADGNLAVKVKERSANDWLMKALKAMVRRLTRFSNELDGLVQAVDAGDLSRRGNVAIFSGGWRELVSGVNNVIDAFVEMTQHNERLKTENLRMSAELEVSQRIQQMVLPSPEELQQMAGVEIVGYMQPADEVGGDYYDVLNTNGTLHIGIGDVTGHGLESGVLMLMTQAAIRTLVEYGETDPVLFFTVLNRVLKKNIERMQADKTLTLAVVNYDHGTLRIVGQHEELLVIRQGGRVERVDTVDLGFPLGLTDEIADFVAEARVVLQSGDSVVLYTDGIPEAENIDGHQYGLDRLCGVLSQHWADPAEAIKQAVIDDVARHIGAHKIYDDVTLLVMKQQ